MGALAPTQEKLCFSFETEEYTFSDVTCGVTYGCVMGALALKRLQVVLTICSGVPPDLASHL